jgi:hypothetical protein
MEKTAGFLCACVALGIDFFGGGTLLIDERTDLGAGINGVDYTEKE